MPQFRVSICLPGAKMLFVGLPMEKDHIRVERAFTPSMHLYAISVLDSPFHIRLSAWNRKRFNYHYTSKLTKPSSNNQNLNSSNPFGSCCNDFRNLPLLRRSASLPD